MSVAHKKDRPEQAVDEEMIARVVEEKTAGLAEAFAGQAEEIKAEVADGMKNIETVKAAGESAAALLSMSFRATIAADRASGANVITDAMILQSADIVQYPEYAVNTPYKKGEIIKSGSLLFEVVAAHTSNAAYPVATTFAYYRLIELAHAGTLDDPIPYPETAGIVVNVKNGLYYSYKGAKYLAKADLPNCVYPPDTVGMWQWEKVK